MDSHGAVSAGSFTASGLCLIDIACSLTCTLPQRSQVDMDRQFESLRVNPRSLDVPQIANSILPSSYGYKRITIPPKRIYAGRNLHESLRILSQGNWGYAAKFRDRP